jgi:hypothetical protein
MTKNATDRRVPSIGRAVRFTSSYTQSPEGADSPIPDDLDRWPIEAEHETRLNWPKLQEVERIKAGISEISLALLLLVVLIGFAIVCWYGIGMAYDYMSTLPIRNQSNPDLFSPNAPRMSSPV